MNKQNNNGTEAMKIKSSKLIYSEIVINATPARIWGILMNFSNYPSWNPFITAISGTPVSGNRLTVTLCPPSGKGIVMKPVVVHTEENKQLRWLGSLGIPYIFDGEHTFMLQDNGDGTTTFRHFENFRGILVPFLKKMLDVDTLKAFSMMNNKLKELAEQR